MRVKQWLVERWPAIRDNAVYDIFKWLFFVFIGGGVFLFMKYILPIWTTISPDEAKAVAILVTLIVLTAISTTYAMAISRHPSLVIRDTADDVKNPPAVRSFYVEVLEVLFQETSGSYGIGRAWHLLMRLRVTNRGPVEPSIVKWELKVGVGSDLYIAELAQIPADWVIERKSETPPTHEIERPSLPELAEREPFRHAAPKTGWILFKTSLWYDVIAAYNTELRFVLHDSLGNTHQHVEPAKWSKKAGEIKRRSSASPDA